MHKLWATFLIAALVAGVFLQCRPTDVGVVLHRYQVAQHSTVLVVSPDGGQGSAVVVHRGSRVFAWTAAHVVSGESDVVVKRFFHFDGIRSGEVSFPARVLFSNEGQDFALLWIVAPKNIFAGAEFDNEIPAVGTATFHVGNWFGADFDNSLSVGIVSQIGVQPGLERWPWDSALDQYAGVAVPGSSGGPIFRKDNGKVLGLVVGGVGRGSYGFLCYVPVRTLATALEFRWALFGSHAPDDAQLYRWHELRKLEVELEK